MLSRSVLAFAIALSIATSASGCVLPPPGHKLAFAVNAGLIVGGIVTAPSESTHATTTLRTTAFVITGLSGIVLTLIGTKWFPPGIKDPPRQSNKRCSPLSVVRCY